MTDFTPATRPHEASDEPLLDSFLREAIPEIKLSLGDTIDRDNSRAIPDKYVRMLPLTIEMRDHLRQEKTGDLPSPLARA